MKIPNFDSKHGQGTHLKILGFIPEKNSQGRTLRFMFVNLLKKDHVSNINIIPHQCIVGLFYVIFVDKNGSCQEFCIFMAWHFVNEWSPLSYGHLRVWSIAICNRNVRTIVHRLRFRAKSKRKYENSMFCFPLQKRKAFNLKV